MFGELFHSFRQIWRELWNSFLLLEKSKLALKAELNHGIVIRFISDFSEIAFTQISVKVGASIGKHKKLNAFRSFSPFLLLQATPIKSKHLLHYQNGTMGTTHVIFFVSLSTYTEGKSCNAILNLSKIAHAFGASDPA